MAKANATNTLPGGQNPNALQYDPKLKTGEGDQLVKSEPGQFGAYFDRTFGYVKLANPPVGYSPSSASMAAQTEQSPIGTRPELALGVQPKPLGQSVNPAGITVPKVNTFTTGQDVLSFFAPKLTTAQKFNNIRGV